MLLLVGCSACQVLFFLLVRCMRLPLQLQGTWNTPLTFKRVVPSHVSCSASARTLTRGAMHVPKRCNLLATCWMWLGTDAKCQLESLALSPLVVHLPWNSQL